MFHLECDSLSLANLVVVFAPLCRSLRPPCVLILEYSEDCAKAKLRRATLRASISNQVSIITSTAERQAAVEFAKAAAMRPRIVSEALNKVAADSDVESAMFGILGTQRLVESKAKITLVPERYGYYQNFWSLPDGGRRLQRFAQRQLVHNI